ncbi:MAG: alpha-amylase, partial [Actinomycetota bacterium]|nr:alpha-amylase [Actinomycetota bacterium]
MDRDMELSVERSELFDLRVERRRLDLLEGLEMLYGPDAAEQLADRLVELALGAYAERSHDLHLLDLRRSLRPDWLQQPEMVGYAAYTERFAGDLRGV